MRTSFLAGVLTLLAAPVAHAEVSPARDAPPVFEKKETVRLILLGDTGEPGPEMERIRRAVSKETKDAIVVLGDLIYPIAPKCPKGVMSQDAIRLLDEHTGGLLRGLGAPVLLMLGNHDVGGLGRHPQREACMLAYAAREPDLVLPALSYDVDFGVLKLSVLNTNNLDLSQAAGVQAAWSGYEGWRILGGHHVYKTYHDKVHEDLVAPWLKSHGLRPDLFVNGHAHVLQFGVYDGIAALTSGATALTREKPTCPSNCGPGQLFGASTPGYALLTATQRTLTVVFKDTAGKVLYTWSTSRKGKGGS